MFCSALGYCSFRFHLRIIFVNWTPNKNPYIAPKKLAHKCRKFPDNDVEGLWPFRRITSYVVDIAFVSTCEPKQRCCSFKISFVVNCKNIFYFPSPNKPIFFFLSLLFFLFIFNLLPSLVRLMAHSEHPCRAGSPFRSIYSFRLNLPFVLIL